MIILDIYLYTHACVYLLPILEKFKIPTIEVGQVFLSKGQRQASSVDVTLQHDATHLYYSIYNEQPFQMMNTWCCEICKVFQAQYHLIMCLHAKNNRNDPNPPYLIPTFSHIRPFLKSAEVGQLHPEFSYIYINIVF